MRFLSILLLAAALAVGTFVFGWWTVPVIALAWGLIAGRLPRAAGYAAIAAVLAWGALLALDAAGGRLFPLGALFGAIAHLPGAVFLALTLIFPAVLAWSAAALGAGVWPSPRSRRYYVRPAEALLDERRRAAERMPLRG
jgi:hypothetical protein